MVSVAEQMNLDLNRARLGLMNISSNRTPASLVKKPEVAKKKQPLQPLKGAKESKSSTTVINRKPNVQKTVNNVSFEDEEMDIEMTRAGYELYDAIRNQRFSEIISLVECGAHAYAKPGLLAGGPLHQLAQSTSDGEVASRFRRRVAELLLAAGLDVNLPDASGRTALMIAARRGHLELLQVLLYWPEVDLIVQDVDGNNALMHALMSRQRDAALAIVSGLMRGDRRLGRSLLERLLRTRNKRALNAFDLARLLGDERLQLLFARVLTGNNWPPTDPMLQSYVPLDLCTDPYLPPFHAWNPLRTSRSLDSICSSLADVKAEESAQITGENKEANEGKVPAPTTSRSLKVSGREGLSSSSEELRRILNAHYGQPLSSASDPLVLDGARIAPLRSLTRNYGLYNRTNGWAGNVGPLTYTPPLWLQDTPYQRLWAQETLNWFNGPHKSTGDASGGISGDQLVDLLTKGEDWTAQRKHTTRK